MWVKGQNKGKNKEKCINGAIIPDRDSRGPRDPESVHRAIVDMRDDLGSVQHTLYGMQNVMDDCQVEQVHGEDLMRSMSVCLDLLEEKFERFISNDWAPF